jgi:phage baseplate assembly protein V
MAKTQDLEQQVGETIQYGVIAFVDHDNATCTVTLGDLTTGELPWVAQRAGAARIWSPPSIGEQCVVLAPEGDLDNGLVVVGLYSDANPPPSNDPDVVQIDMPDGASFSYNQATHALAITLPAGGTMTVEAPGGTSWTGNIDVEGTVNASEDVIGGGKSLKGHKHSGVQAGTAQTGAPV